MLFNEFNFKLEETERRLSSNVTRCGYTESYQNMGILNLGAWKTFHKLVKILDISLKQPLTPVVNLAINSENITANS